MHRLVPLFPLCATVAVSGCKDPAAPSAAIASVIQPASDITISALLDIAPSGSTAGSDDDYYVVSLRFTNDEGMTVEPVATHFVLVDRDNRRYYGMESGDAALVGIANADVALAQGQSHDYTIGFRVPRATTGTLFYDTTL